MSKFLKRTLGLCSALLMSLVSCPSTHAAIVYTAGNLFFKIFKVRDLYVSRRDDESDLVWNDEVLRQKTNEILDGLLKKNITGQEQRDDSLERQEDIKCPICEANITHDEYAYSCEGCLKANKPDLYHVHCVVRKVMEYVLSDEEITKGYMRSRNIGTTCSKCGGPAPRYTPNIIVPDAKLPVIR